MIWYIIVILIVIIFFIIKQKYIETFINNKYDIYVINLHKDERIKNIENQQKKVSQEIVLIDGIDGQKLIINDLINQRVLSSEDHLHTDERVKKREIGCYLSHLNIYNKIKNDNKIGYTIIFEDDFKIDVDNFLEKVDELIVKLNNNNVEFDILFLGNHPWNERRGTHIVDNLYKMGNDELLSGMQGYVINNKHVNKLINEISYIDIPIDIKIQNATNENKINGVAIFPYYVTTIDVASTILVFENFENMKYTLY